MTEVDYDVAIIGGGPGGSTTAAYLARAGLSCAVFESEVFARPHVGESLVPATTPVFRDIGVLDKLDEAGFPRKYGAAWTSATTGPTDRMGFSNLLHDFRAADVLFSERDQAGVGRDFTYHVDRGRFDQILLQHANSLGAKVFEDTRVRRVDFSVPQRPQVVLDRGGRETRVSANVVVDASGRKTVLGRQLGLKVIDPVFDQYAVHTWFDGFDRSALSVQPEQLDYIFIHFLPLSNTWVWQIPITDTITSIGVVTQKATFTRSGLDREAFFWKVVGSRPELTAALRAAEQVRPFKTEGDYSYSMTEVCGDGFVLIGDAARFVDPIFSSGVSVAVNSARLAAADIIAAAAAGTGFRKPAFATFETRLRRAVKSWYEFISLYYRLNILFTAFVQDPRYRLDVLKMLQGDVYDDEEPAALAAMREIVRAVERDPDHLWHRYLGDLGAPAAELV